MNIRLYRDESSNVIKLYLRGQTEDEHTTIRDFMLREGERYDFKVDDLVHIVSKVQGDDQKEQIRMNVPEGLSREDLDTMAGQVGAKSDGTDLDVAKSITKARRRDVRARSVNKRDK